MNQIILDSGQLNNENCKSHPTMGKKIKQGFKNARELAEIISTNSLNPMMINDKKLHEIKGEKQKWYGSIKSLTVTPILLLLFIVIVVQSIN